MILSNRTSNDIPPQIKILNSYPSILINDFTLALFLVLVNKIFEHKIEKIFLPIHFNICFGAQKNRLIEMVLLSTHNIYFGRKIRKLIFIRLLFKRPALCNAS